MAKPTTIIEWLKEAGQHAFECEDPERLGSRLLVDVLVGGSTIGVRVRRRAGSDHQQYNCVTWSAIERAEVNPLLKLIDETIAGI
jgi:hypothetical protein